MNETKRLLREIIALYELEGTLRDLYVEGPLDKVVYENFIRLNSLDITSIPIDTIDFTDADKKYLYSLDTKSNRDKAILLSRILKDVNTDSQVVCIADKDLDHFTIGVEINKYLWRTDYSCLESYYFDEGIVDRLIKFGFQNINLTTGYILNQLEGVLQLYFALRIARQNVNPSMKLPEITKMVSITKKGETSFDKENVVKALLNNNKIKSEGDKKKITESIEKTLDEVRRHAIRNTINGHDFVDLLLYYLDVVKNTNNFKGTNFHRTLLMSAESRQLENFDLFKRLVRF